MKDIVYLPFLWYSEPDCVGRDNFLDLEGTYGSCGPTSDMVLVSEYFVRSALPGLQLHMLVPFHGEGPRNWAFLP